MTADLPGDTTQNPRTNLATQEKIREFCYELALALRRITGKVFDDDVEFLDEGERRLPDTLIDTTLDQKSDL